MQNVTWHLFDIHTLVHDVAHVDHFEFFVTVKFHEALLEEDLLVKETFLAGQGFQALRDVVVAVSNDNDQEVILGEVSVFSVGLQGVVVVQAASKCRLQLFDLLVVHRDAHCKCGVLLSDAASCADLRDHARVLDLTVLGVCPETGRPQLLVERGLSEHECLIRHVLCWLPWSFLSQRASQSVFALLPPLVRVLKLFAVVVQWLL